jgi:GTPase
MAELDAMLAAAKPGATPSLVARAAEIEAEKAAEAATPVRVYAPEEQRCGLIAIVGKPNVASPR